MELKLKRTTFSVNKKATQVVRKSAKSIGPNQEDREPMSYLQSTLQLRY